MKSEIKIENELENIEIVIDSKSTNEGDKSTKRLQKNCSKCNDVMTYTTKAGLVYGLKNNSKCIKCRRKPIDLKFIRNCPTCDVEIITTNGKYFRKCERLKSQCLSCSLKSTHRKMGNILKDDVMSENRVCSQCNRQLTSYKTKNIKCRVCKSCAAKNKYYANDIVKDRLLVGIKDRENRPKREKTTCRFNRNCPKCDRTISHPSLHYVNTHKSALCKSCSGRMVIDRLGGISPIKPSYNPVACKRMDEYGIENNHNFQHALNGGEKQILGYWLDGYDEDKNVIFEYDEKFHFSFGKLKNKDIIRMDEIGKHLKCKFIRMNEKGEIYMEKDYSEKII